VTDLDGTLLRSDRTLSGAESEALARLAAHRVVRAVATGRSLFSFRTVPVANLPVDFVIFSSGAGVVEHPGGRLLRGVSFEPAELEEAFAVLSRLPLDVMVHRAVPESHAFAYRARRPPHPDFERRLAIYREAAFPLAGGVADFGPAAQLVAIAARESGEALLAEVRRALPGFTVIRTTSPLDGEALWIEVFPAEVSKSLTARWLAEQLGVSAQRTLAVGNDYNDLDLLAWAAARFVTANAPEELRRRFPAVASNNAGGVAEAVARWLAAPGPG
jgi:hypothetical protein